MIFIIPNFGTLIGNLPKNIDNMKKPKIYQYSKTMENQNLITNEKILFKVSWKIFLFQKDSTF